MAWAREGAAVLKGFDWNKIVAKNDADGLSREGDWTFQWAEKEKHEPVRRPRACVSAVRRL